MGGLRPNLPKVISTDSDPFIGGVFLCIKHNIMNNKPNYYAVLTAEVRYDKSLSSSEKLFYAEITALANKNGYCYASNSFFAELYDVKKSTISAWVKKLTEKGHISVDYDRDGKVIKQRKIYITNKHFKGGQKIDQGVVRKSDGGSQKIGGRWSENPKENITSNNITSNNREGAKIPTIDEVKEYFGSKGYNLELATTFFNYYDEPMRDNGSKVWKDRDGRSVKSWKQKALTWMNHNKDAKIKTQAGDTWNNTHKI